LREEMNTLSLSDRKFLFNITTAIVAAIVEPDDTQCTDLKLAEIRKEEKSQTYVPRTDDDIVTDLKIQRANMIMAKVFDD